jgi:Flp pilus assembly protein TadD
MGWLWFLGMLAPVVGLVSFSIHGSADRYTYLPMIGPFIAIVWWAADVARQSRSARIAVVGVVVVALPALTIAARVQASHWQTSESLFRHAVAASPGNALMHSKLGIVLARQGKLDEAAAQHELAIESAPRFVRPYNDLGIIRMRQGRVEEASESFSTAIRIEPDDAIARFNLGIALVRLGKVEEGRRERQRALQIDPSLGKRER